jgi:hypothetical protein
MFRALLCPSSGALSNCRFNIWFPYAFGGGRVSNRGRFVSGETDDGHYYAQHQEPFQTAVAASGFRTNAEVDVFPTVVGLLVGRQMMGIIMPETC